MPASLFADDFQIILDQARDLGSGSLTLTPSPEDWRDQWIYFLMVDRFSNSQSPPLSMTLHLRLPGMLRLGVSKRHLCWNHCTTGLPKAVGSRRVVADAGDQELPVRGRYVS